MQGFQGREGRVALVLLNLCHPEDDEGDYLEALGIGGMVESLLRMPKIIASPVTGTLDSVFFCWNVLFFWKFKNQLTFGVDDWKKIVGELVLCDAHVFLIHCTTRTFPQLFGRLPSGAPVESSPVAWGICRCCHKRWMRKL